MARPRIAESRKLLSGTLRPSRSRRAAAGERLTRSPPAPAALSDGARIQWAKIVPVVVRLGTATEADLLALALLAETLATEASARAEVERDGLSVPAGGGGRKANPAIKVMEVARNQIARLLAEFGMTPRGRQHVDPAPQGPTHNLDATAEFFD